MIEEKVKINRLTEEIEKLKVITNKVHPKKGEAVLNIELDDEFTRIDFYYRSPDHYYKGGWITMESNSYIQPVGSEVKYPLLRTENIPLAPEKYYFTASGEHHYYTLYFAPIPKDTKIIDIIEKKAPGNFFNFFGIEVNSGVVKVNEFVSMN